MNNNFLATEPEIRFKLFMLPV